MKNDEVVHAVQDAPMPRRDFLRKSMLLALPAAFGGMAAPAVAAISMSSPLPPALSTAAFNPPSRVRGSTEINVRNRGAFGDGVHDDTAAFQEAIDALPSNGGTVFVPAGTYMIDAVRQVNLRSRMHLRLASGAVLKAKANAADWANVLMVHKVSDVEISGGEIVGDRDRHQSTTGQWGIGIMVRGSARVTIRDILIRKCWGDGIWIGSSYRAGDQPSIRSNDVVVANVACTGNRRQGMSISQANNVRVYDSEFSYTSGLFPSCGIDIEPDVHLPGTTTSVHIENCSIHHNHGNGIQIYELVESTTVKRCVIELNRGYGVQAIGARNGYIALNHIRSNGMIGFGARRGSRGFTLSGNRFYNNGRNFRERDLPMLTPPSSRVGNVLPRHTEVSASQNISINTNLYYDD